MTEYDRGRALDDSLPFYLPEHAVEIAAALRGKSITLRQEAIETLLDHGWQARERLEKYSGTPQDHAFVGWVVSVIKNEQHLLREELIWLHHAA